MTGLVVRVHAWFRSLDISMTDNVAVKNAGIAFGAIDNSKSHSKTISFRHKDGGVELVKVRIRPPNMEEVAPARTRGVHL